MAVAEPRPVSPDGEAPIESEERVTPLELFFDLVFVFAITQVTTLMSNDPTWGGIGRGMLVLAALWWAWAAYAWLTNEVDAESGAARLVIFVAMAAMLVVSLATPGAFGADALLFACAYLVVRAMHILLFASATDDVNVRQSAMMLTPTSGSAVALLFAASAFDGPVQSLLWLAALAIDYGGPALFGVAGWRVSPGHFAERHGLIIIIALGESIVSIGVGAGGHELGTGEVTAAVLGTALVGALWWAYFDVVAIVAERTLHRVTGSARNRQARDSYSYLHLPMVAGIVLMALGVKKTLAHVGEPLDGPVAAALFGGVALYLLAHVLFRLRNVHSFNPHRTAAAVACLALIPVATQVDALAALALVTAVSCALIAYEAIRFSEARARVRAAG
jgi:low temperature requirement protein LtrA